MPTTYPLSAVQPSVNDASGTACPKSRRPSTCQRAARSHLIINAVGARRQRVRIIERHLSTPVTIAKPWAWYAAQPQGGICEESRTVTSDVTRYTTRLLTPDTWDDFAGLVEANNGVWGGCWCIGFHPEGISKDSTVAGNREAKLAHVKNGTIHQMLVSSIATIAVWAGVSSGHRPRWLPSRTPRPMKRA
jgi:hypothetical protein